MTISEAKKGAHKKSVHHVLARSYFAFFMSVVVGIGLHSLYPADLFPVPQREFGMLIILLSTMLIIWAQTTSNKGRQERYQSANLTHEHFLRGPYKYLRSPTNVGLTALVVGYGFLINSLMLVISVIVFAIVIRAVLIPKEERILESRFGDSYREYKKRVRI